MPFNDENEDAEDEDIVDDDGVVDFVASLTSSSGRPFGPTSDAGGLSRGSLVPLPFAPSDEESVSLSPGRAAESTLDAGGVVTGVAS